MGSDIHSYAEVRRGGEWEKVGAVWPHYWDQDRMTDSPYSSRSYNTFAVLAGVRNEPEYDGRSYAPIAPPRGLPDDVTEEVDAASREWGRGGHSHTWHSLRHFLDYPHWGAASLHNGLVDAGQYKVFLEKGRPESWCGGVGGGGTRITTREEMDRLLAEGADTRGVYCRIHWTNVCRATCWEFYEVALPRLFALASDVPVATEMFRAALDGDVAAKAALEDWLAEHDRPGLDDVRFICFFDN